MKVSYQNYRQQKQSSKVMRTYIVQAATKGATEEELDILCQAYLLEQKYGLAGDRIKTRYMSYLRDCRLCHPQ